MDENGLARNVEGPMAKLYSSEALTRAAEDLSTRSGRTPCGPTSSPPHCATAVWTTSSGSPSGTTIYAGSSEVQRNIIGQRGLGLPR